MTDFANTPSDRVSRDGGHVGVTLLSLATQATTTETGCRECYITSGAVSNAVHFSINTSTTVSLGALVPAIGALAVSAPSPTPLRVPIDDVSKLWFFGITAGLVGITYRT
ncbi:hypothetical protein LCGC14_1904670 [marine sediment metagenome]|uniref:Uncharacterized protein n=1 Tax=marine sediment metagenome TaxID=412755 RepID=A0A0F9FVG7_9ZZZZ